MKTDQETLDPITNDDSLAETPRETVDPVPDEAKTKRKRRPSMKRKAKDADSVR